MSTTHAPTDADLKHIDHIRDEFDEMVEQKYLQGVAEHGGFLPKKPVDREVLAEAIDQVVYAITLRDQIDEVCDLARRGLNDEEDARTSCFHILQTLGRIVEIPQLPDSKTRSQLEKELEHYKELSKR